MHFYSQIHIFLELSIKVQISPSIYVFFKFNVPWLIFVNKKILCMFKWIFFFFFWQIDKQAKNKHRWRCISYGCFLKINFSHIELPHGLKKMKYNSKESNLWTVINSLTNNSCLNRIKLPPSAPKQINKK